MKTRWFFLSFLLGCSAVAAEPSNVLQALSVESGLSVRDVKMVVGARTGHAEYLASYDQTKRRFVRALGKSRYQALMAGEPIALRQPGQRREWVALAVAPR